MALSEIEKLERRYAENPQGLTFAPLAEVHRKNGDVAAGARAAPARSDAPSRLHPRQHRARPLPPRPGRPARGRDGLHPRARAGRRERHRAQGAGRHHRAAGPVRRGGALAPHRCSPSTGATTRPATSSAGWRPRAGRPRSAAVGSTPRRPHGATSLERPETPRLGRAGDAAATSGAARRRGCRGAGRTGHERCRRMPEPPRERDAGLGGRNPAAPSAAEAAPLELEELDLSAGDDAVPPEGIELEQPVTPRARPVEPLAGLVGRERSQPPRLGPPRPVG